MAAQPVDYDALRSEWSVFFELLNNDRGIKLRLNMPDTLVLRRGQPVAWLATNKEGYVVSRPAGRSSMDDVRTHLLACAVDENGRSAHYVAVMRGPDGVPKLLTRPALDVVCEQLSAAAEAEDASAAVQVAPCALQAYVAPFLDLRFVTSYTNDGVNISCHTFQRRFSRRYLQYRDPAVPGPQPGKLTGSPGSQASMDSAAVAAPGLSAAGLMQPVSGEAAGEAAEGSTADMDADVSLLDDAALADSERSLGRTLGPVDPALKMIARKAAHGVVQYVQKAHLLTLRGLVCEFVRDCQGHLWFMGPLRADWASLIPGRGGEPWANANLTQQPRDEESWPSTVNDEVDAASHEAEQQQQQQQQQQQGRAAPTSQGPGGGSSLPLVQQVLQQVQQVAGLGPLAGSAAESSRGGHGVAAADINRLLPAPALQQLNYTAKQPASPGATTTVLAAGPGSGSSSGSGSGGARVKLAGSPDPASLSGSQQQSPQQPALKAAGRLGLGQGGSGHKERQHSAAHATSPGGTAPGRSCLLGSPQKASSVITSHLTKEVESLKDELLVKMDLADALACKVQELEHDKHVITGAFESVIEGMQGDLREVKERLEALRLERDTLSLKLTETGLRLAGAEAEREQLRSMLDAERGAAFLSLGQFQKQQEDAGVRAARAEAELRSVQERLREEQAALDGLKKLMVFYQHTVGDISGLAGAPAGDPSSRVAVLRGLERPELKYAETLHDVDDLLLREADPSGERYALSKVLHTCQSDLHAIFLYYCMLDTGFTRQWPPQLTLTSWLAFMKDIGSTNLVPGTRTRYDNTMHVQEATEVFRRYCLRQAVMRGGGPLSIRGPSVARNESTTASAAAAAAAGAAGEQPPRPPSGQSTASAAVARPISAPSSAQLAGSTMTYQSFCAALVHVAAKAARGSAEALDACPFLSEQTRAFIELILPKAQRVVPIGQASARAGGRGAGAAAAAGGKSTVVQVGGLGAKEAAAKEAAAKLPKLKKAKEAKGRPSGVSREGGVGGSEMSAIAEASRETQKSG